MPFLDRSPQQSSANAARGGLKPPPAGRLRRAYLHHPNSTNYSAPDHLPTHRTPFTVRDTRRGKVRIAGLTCGDPDWRPRPASAGTSVAWTCSWGVLLLPRSERPGGSSADETTALGAAPQPPHDDICPGQVLVWRLCLGPDHVMVLVAGCAGRHSPWS